MPPLHEKQHEKSIEISEISTIQLRKAIQYVFTPNASPNLVCIIDRSINLSPSPSLSCVEEASPSQLQTTWRIEWNKHPTLALLLWQLSKSSLVITHAVGVSFPLSTTTIKGKLQLRATVRT
jgi:hypothetical protein